MAAARNNLTKMSLDELVALRDRVQAQLNKRIETERAELEQRIDSLKDLAQPSSSSKTNGATRPRKLKKAHPLKGRKARAKYKGPEGQTWSGRGLAPRWLAELEKKGQKRDKFLIKP